MPLGPVGRQIEFAQTRRGESDGLAASQGFAVLAGEQFVLLGPVQRQIEFGQPRRGELDGLPTLQDRLDELRAQEARPTRRQM